MSESRRNLSIRVWRQEPGAAGRLVDYRVQVPAEGMVVDALFAIQHEMDSSLAFRVNCRAGMCGSCALRVDGRERLACQTPLALVGESVKIEPLRHLPVLKDLVVDLGPFFEKYGRIHPEFRAVPGPLPGPPRKGEGDIEARKGVGRSGSATSVLERELVERALNCISCGACFSACDVAGLNPRFLGPAALARVWALVGGDGDSHLKDAVGQDGVWRCHDLGVCTTVCPKAVAPTLAIQALRRRSLWKR